MGADGTRRRLLEQGPWRTTAATTSSSTRRLASGERGAFDELYRRYGAPRTASRTA